MICPKCATAADLTEAAADLFTPNRETEDPWYGRDGLDDEQAEQAFYVAAAIVRLHSACTGGGQGCGCQHRGTGVATHYADREQARVTSPAVSA